MNSDIFLQKYSCEDCELMTTFDMLCLKAACYIGFELRNERGVEIIKKLLRDTKYKENIVQNLVAKPEERRR